MTKVIYRNSWSEDEKELLALYVIESIKEGNSLTNGLKKFINETSGDRSLPAVRFQWHNQVKKQYEKEYNEALLQKNKSVQYNAQTQDTFIEKIDPTPAIPVPTIVNDRFSNVIEGLQNKQITQSDLIYLLSEITITNDSEEQLKKVQSELDIQKRINGEMAQEFEALVNAMNVARKHFTNTDKLEKGIVFHVDQKGVVSMNGNNGD